MMLQQEADDIPITQQPLLTTTKGWIYGIGRLRRAFKDAPPLCRNATRTNSHLCDLNAKCLLRCHCALGLITLMAFRNL